MITPTNLQKHTITPNSHPKTFNSVYGVARYGISTYGTGIAGGGLLVNLAKNINSFTNKIKN